MRTRRLAGCLMLAGCLVTACSAPAGHPAAATRSWPPDPRTVAALLRIAQVFNTDYDSGRYGAVPGTRSWPSENGRYPSRSSAPP